MGKIIMEEFREKTISGNKREKVTKGVFGSPD
jgi:hypothetical protein